MISDGYAAPLVRVHCAVISDGCAAPWHCTSKALQRRGGAKALGPWSSLLTANSALCAGRGLGFFQKS